MTKIWKRIPIMLSIVVALMALVDVSCSSSQIRTERIVRNSQHIPQLDGNIVDGNQNGDSCNVPALRSTSIFGRNWKVITFCSLVFFLVLNFIAATVLHSSRSSNGVKELGEKVEQGKLVMQTSSKYTTVQLENIAQKLTTPLPLSKQFPPVKLSTSSGTTEYYTTKHDTTEYEAFTEVPTAEVTTAAPHDDCMPVGRIVYDFIRKILPNSRKARYVFDESEIKIANIIKQELRAVQGQHCGYGYFEMQRRHNKDVLFFDDRSRVVKSVIKESRCVQVAVEVIPILQRHKPTDWLGYAWYHVQQTPRVNANMVAAIDYGTINNCGPYYFDYGVYGAVVVVTHKRSAPYIAEAWKRRFDAHKCQVAADAIVFVLNERNSRTNNYNAKNTIPDSDGKRDILVQAYSHVLDCNCEYGSIKVEENIDNVVVTYKTTNRFAMNAWAKVNHVVACRRISSEVLNYLLDLELYSLDEHVTFTIPDKNDNIRTLLGMLDLNRQFTCNDGFFTHTDDGEQFQLSYSRQNLYIDTFWKTLPQEKVCKMAAERIIPYLIKNGYFSNDIEPVLIMNNNTVRKQILKWLRVVNRSACGAGFPFQGQKKYRYTIEFDTRNKFILSTWMENSARILCPKAAAAVVSFLEPLDAFTTVKEAQNTYYHCDVDKNILANAVNIASNLNCGNGFFALTHFSNKIRVSYKTANAYIRTAWAPYLHDMVCRQIAEDVAFVIDSKGREYRSDSADETFHRWKYNLAPLDRVGKLVANKNCGNGYFVFKKGLMYDNFKYKGSNKFVKAAWRKLERNQVCAPAAKEIVSILFRMRMHEDLRQENHIPAFVEGDLDRLTDATDSAKGVNCDDDFASLVWKDGSVTIEYEMSNKFMRRAWAEAFGDVPRIS